MGRIKAHWTVLHIKRLQITAPYLIQKASKSHENSH